MEMALLTQIKGIEQLSRPDTFKAITIIKKIKTHPDYRRLFENFASLSVLQALNYILPLITFPYLVRVLGVEKFGLLAFANATIGYFQIITDYGFNLSATREIAIHRENKEKVQEIFSAVMTIKFGLMLLSLILLSILVFSFEKFRQDWEVYFLTFGMVVGNTLFPVWFFQGMERMKYITLLNIVAKGVFTVAIFILIREQSDYWKVPLINSIGVFIAGCGSLLLSGKNFKINMLLPSKNAISRQIRNGFNIFCANISISLFTISNTFILGLFTDKMTVGYYAAYEKIVRMLISLFYPIFQTFYPTFNRLFEMDTKKFFRYYSIIFRLTFLISFLMYIFVLCFSKNIILLLFGSDYIFHLNSFIVISLLILSNPIAYLIFNIGLLSLKLDEYFLRIYLFGGIGNIVLVVVLVGILKFSVLGASIALITTEFATTILAYVIMQANSKYFKIKSGVKT